MQAVSDTFRATAIFAVRGALWNGEPVRDGVQVESIPEEDVKEDYQSYLEWYRASYGNKTSQIDLKPDSVAFNFIYSPEEFALVRTWTVLLKAFLRSGHERAVLMLGDCRQVGQLGQVGEPVLHGADIVRVCVEQHSQEAGRLGGPDIYRTPMVAAQRPVGTRMCVMTASVAEAMHAELVDSQPARYKATADLLLWKLSFDHQYTDFTLRRYVASEKSEKSEKPEKPTANGLTVDFVFIIPSYNNERWVRQNVGSVCEQAYPRWRAIYVSDASTDGTLAAAKQAVVRYGKASQFTFIDLPERRHQAHARYVAYNHPSCRPHEVAVLLDGDDWLLHRHVLLALARLYTEKGLQVSHGQFKYFKAEGGLDHRTVAGTGEYPESVRERAAYRTHGVWAAQHLRTATVQLLQRIPADYLIHDGRWIDCCTDVAEMMFLLEACDGRHANAGEPLMVYNRANSALHPNSYYNQHMYPERKAYRNALLRRYAPGLLPAVR